MSPHRKRFVLFSVMPRLWFDPVDIWVSDTKRQTVTSVEEAARLLIEAWPAKFARSKKNAAARKACLAALETEKMSAVSAARAAFLKAAEEAGMG
ncbi:hypothetical protein CHELA1G11_12000 [Hyphomicrobiales bacterium]|nr:hypothetical protein CHELA1G11_12000 [Hyphomicrobiales bacterium]CAH1663988.1 hypothetical protein CHELA1G2_12313 [Hyphomicrobiales bacterium]